MEIRKNIKWIALGFIGVCLFVFLWLSIIFLVMEEMKGDAYQLSLVEIKNNKTVIEKIGKTIDSGWFVTGRINTSGSNGSATLDYSLRGSISDARAYVNALKKSGQWKLVDVVVVPENADDHIWVVQSGKSKRQN